MLHSRAIVLFILTVIVHVLAKTENSKQDEVCGDLYKKGVAAYLENRFEDCVTFLEKSVQEYKAYTKALIHCRLKCMDEAETADPLYPVDVDNLHFYEKTIRATLCMIKCRQNHDELADTYNISEETENIFEEQKPYEYLHLCYFQNDQKQKAASAAFTYLVTHPKDESMIKNLEYYTSLPEIKVDDIINFEAKEYVYLYTHGVAAYENEDWKGVEGYMEESLLSYVQSETDCRAQCEGPLDQGWYPDLIPAIANHFTHSLSCKRKCLVKLSNLNGEHREDLLASHFHYLQYAYYKNGNLKAACQAAATYVLFLPEDETMRENIEYYKKLPKVEASYFTPRPEMVQMVRRLKYEARLLDYIKREYVFKRNTKQVVKKESIELFNNNRIDDEKESSPKGASSIYQQDVTM